MAKHKITYALPVATLLLGLGIFVPSAWAAPADTAEEDEQAAETADDALCTEASKDACEASTWETLKAGLDNAAVSEIKLTDDITAGGWVSIGRGLTLDGNGKTIKGSSNAGIYITAMDKVLVKNLTFVNTYNKDTSGYGVLLMNSRDTYDITLDSVVLQGVQRGIYNMADYYGAVGNLTIKNSTIQWIDTDGNPVEDPATQTAGKTQLPPYGYSYGIVTFGIRGSWTIEDSKISGWRYASQISSNSAGGKLTIKDSDLTASRSDIDSFATATEESHFTIDVINSKLHGINLYGGNQENYANVLFEKSATYTDMTFDNTEFTVYENETALGNYFANQYAITNRAAGTNNTNTAVFKGESSYIVPAEYLAAKVQFTNFMEEPTWGTDEIEATYESEAAEAAKIADAKERETAQNAAFAKYAAAIRALSADEQKALRSTEAGLTRWYGTEKIPANSGITVEGGTYSYNPVEFVKSEALDVYRTSDGQYKVAEKPEVSLPEVIYLQPGESYTVELPEVAKTLGAFESENESAIVKGDTIIAEKVGKGQVKFSLYGSSSNISKDIDVVVYDVTPDAKDDTEAEDRDAVADYVSGEIAKLIAGGTSESVVLAGQTDADGNVTKTGVELLKEKLADGYTLETAVEFGDYVDEAAYADTEAYTEIANELKNDEKILGLINGYVRIYATKGDDSESLGLVRELGDAVTLSIELTDEQMAAEEGYAKKFFIIRGHDTGNGVETTRIEGDELTWEGNTLSFENDKFSTFALAYVTVAVNNGSADGGLVVPTTVDITEAETTAEDVAATTPDSGTVTAAGASAMSAGMMAAGAVAVIAVIAGTTAIIRRK